MKLPENYQNWIEFAKRCDEILQKNPEATRVKTTIDGKISNDYSESEFLEYNISSVKAKAFDEVMENVVFTLFR